VDFALLGVPNSGKSTVFCALTGEPGHDSPAPFFTEYIARAPFLLGEDTAARAMDTPGIARDSHAGEWRGLGWIEEVREADALVLVLKSFQTGAGPLEQPGCAGDVLYDLEMLERELRVADLRALERTLGETAPGDPDRELAETIGSAIAGGQPASGMGLDLDELRDLLGVTLLTALPVIYLVNIDEMGEHDPTLESVTHLLAERLEYRGAAVVTACARLHADAALLGPGQAEEFLEELGVDRSLAMELTYVAAHLGEAP